MQARPEATSSSDVLSARVFQKHLYFGTAHSASAVNHASSFATAAASLRYSIASSQSDAVNARRFLADSCNTLAAAYEQLSSCAFAAHSLRRRIPCVHPDDVMRSCRVTFAALSSAASGGDEIPYPIVWGSDFEIRLSAAEIYSSKDAAARLQTTDPLSAHVESNQVPQDDICQTAHVSDNQCKRRRMDLEEDAAATGAAHDATTAQRRSPATPLPADSRIPGTEAALASQDFDWLPGNGVVS
jgi:hypothetical protein